MNISKLIKLSVLLLAVLISAKVAQAEEKKICSSTMNPSQIDGYQITQPGGNLRGQVKLQPQTGAFSITAEGRSELKEKVTLHGDTKIYAVARHDKAIILYGYTVNITVVEGNARLGLPNVLTYLYWQPNEKTIFVTYDHPYLENTELSYQQTDC